MASTTSTSSGSTAATPLVNMRGLYELIQPWYASNTVLYTCKSLQAFTQVEDNGTKGYETYYKPMGLLETDWVKDRNAGAFLCGLFGDDGSVIYVPDVYIQRYPSQANPQYSNFVVSALLGPLPSDFNFEAAKAHWAEVLSDMIGIEPEMYVETLDNSTVLTPEQAQATEAARRAAIKNRTTTWALYKKLQQDYDRLKVTANTLAGMVKP
ncbi:MAG: hypothetical protein EOM43_19100 [Gammaproteobacteria bacterium]|nr:hypothetical protein [Gammaproteobacteria bacterium]